MPAAVIVVGAAIAAILVYRYAAAPRRSAASRKTLTRVGAVTMLVAIAAGCGAAGIVFRTRPEDVEAPVVARVVLAAAGVATASGLALRLGASSARNIRVVGVRGEAYVRSIREIGPGAGGVPVWEIDVDVTAPDVAAFRTTVRESIPRVMAETIRPGGRIPVLVDDSPVLRVAVDWISSPDRGFGEGFGPGPAPDGALSRGAPPGSGPPLASLGSPSTVERLLRPAIAMAALGAVAAGVAVVAGGADGEPTRVRPGAYASTSFGAEVSGAGYTFTTPPGWRESAVSLPAVGANSDVDVSLVSPTFVRAALTVSRLREATPATKIERLLPALARDAGGEALGARGSTVDGRRAVELDLGHTGGIRSRMVVVRHDRRVLVVSLSAFEGDWEGAEAALVAVLDSWRWE